jgi:nucleotide-binding universal stress UspA family protein
MFTKILVGYDGSNAAKLALSRVASLAKLGGAQVTALWVQSPRLRDTNLPREPEEETSVGKDAFSQLTKEIAAVAAEFGVPIISETLSGQVAGTLRDYATVRGFDLIALGQSQHSLSEGRLLGDVADCVSNIAPCSVLIVKS